MGYMGARYESAEALRIYLHLSRIENDAAVNLAYADVTRALLACTYEQASEQYPANATLPHKVHVAARIYLPITHCLLDQFGAGLRTHYGADIGKVPFHTDKERARQEMNQWAEERTQQTVRDLVRPLSLAAFVSIVLASALYFRPAWDRKFWTAGTTTLGFFRPSPSDEAVRVVTLRAKHALRHGTVGDADCRVVELPFADARFVLLLFLPNQVGKGALEATEAKLGPQVLGRLDDFLRRTKIEVALPKLDFDEQLSLGGVVHGDGAALSRLFARGKADFSGISGNNNLHLSHVEHKARFEVEELKRKVIDASRLKDRGQSADDNNAKMQKNKIEFDRPFLFAVRDTYLDMFLLMGCVRNLPAFNPD